jgi:hypothetical protein
MPTLPTPIIALLSSFAPLFSQPVFRHALVLLVGAILTPGRRTVSNALRVMGLAHTHRFQNYHRVLNRDKWSSRHAARVLLGLLVRAFVPSGPVLVGIDETLERRQGDKIAAKGIYRDAARSSKSFLVKSSGLRWISLMLLAPIPWAGRVWALPFLTVLAPSERYDQERKRRHKTLSRWAQQMVIQIRRWLPERPLVLVADSGYAVLSFLDRCASLALPVTVITRLRLDAALFEPASERSAGQIGRPRKKGQRLPTLQQILDDGKTHWSTVTVERWYSRANRTVEIVSGTAVWYHGGMPPVSLRYVLIRDPAQGAQGFKPQALLCTDLSVDPEQIVSWFVLRWQLETTFQEVRTHLGVETQRQWNDRAILRTTPALLGLFSLVALLADEQAGSKDIWLRQAAWYVKERPTFSDALASVRRELWAWVLSCPCLVKSDVEKLPNALMERFAETLCYAN